MSFVQACPSIDPDTIDADIREDHAIITWQITGRVTRVDILSCDADGNIQSCVNTTQANPENGVPVRVNIPSGAVRYKFDLYLYGNGDLVQSYENEDWLVIGSDVGKPYQQFNDIWHAFRTIYRT